MNNMIALTVEQMDILKNRGLDITKYNTDLYWSYLTFHDPAFRPFWSLQLNSDCIIKYNKDNIPAFILEDILKILPNWIEERHYQLTFDNKNRPRYYITHNGYFECWVGNVELEESDSALDAAYKLLIWCLDNKYIK